MVYHRPLRQLEGFLQSVFSMLGVELPVPDHSSVSRRGRSLGKRNIRAITRLGRREWYRVSGASTRARVENGFWRYKVLLGREMRARTLAGQRVEAHIGAKILNRMAQLGMPESTRMA